MKTPPVLEKPFESKRPDSKIDQARPILVPGILALMAWTFFQDELESHTVEVQVLDSNQTPVSGMQLQVLYRGNPMPMNAKTDAQGLASFEIQGNQEYLGDYCLTDASNRTELVADTVIRARALCNGSVSISRTDAQTFFTRSKA